MSEHRLGEIVIERPRHGMRISLTKTKGFQKNLYKITQEATEEGLLSPYLIKTKKRTKCFSDHIAPLYRWLRSKVGTPWDEVYCEFCQKLDIRTLSGQHILSHVWGFVERDVVLIDGIPYRRNYQQQPLAFWSRSKEQLYVHPETGILCKVEKTPKIPAVVPDDVIKINYFQQYRKLDDIWYLVELKELPDTGVANDVFFKQIINRQLAQRIYGGEIYAVSKKQCNKKEIKWIMQNQNRKGG